MHSHHSHSGDYISHANGTLESMVATARSMGFTHYCLTEHMPRLSDEYLYPEEIEKEYNVTNLKADFQKFLRHGREIQARINNEVGNDDFQILVGFEVEGIDSAHIRAAKTIMNDADMCVGSVHYVHGIPIDFNRDLWLEARAKCKENTTRCLYKDYFDLQYEVLTELRPQVVGHFDLIRLFEEDEIDPTTGMQSVDISVERDWPEVWSAITRNIEFVVSYGGLFELNSAAVRKGWPSPYPRLDLALAIKNLGGKFCLSDDAHTTEQVGLNYKKVLDYIQSELQLSHIYHLQLENGKAVVVSDSVSDLSKLDFWRQ
ncbi:hypothetical protein HF325_002937 [Metschnikowia pulcherrima]|uniref:Histidinol-phosphatase n=1 Tax=Metschnikowia pulcherrima TaxID=27326 RepID=A0A8H7GSV9_9ASCO|nr:hypothetical protein HF325_002937 [Metschnikowia pulcherrima]